MVIYLDRTTPLVWLVLLAALLLPSCSSPDQVSSEQDESTAATSTTVAATTAPTSSSVPPVPTTEHVPEPPEVAVTADAPLDQVLGLASGWSLRVPAAWEIDEDPLATFEAGAEQFDGEFGIRILTAVQTWGDRLEGVAGGPNGANVIAVAIPAFPHRFDLGKAEQTLSRGFEASPLEVVELGVDFVDLVGTDYGILGRVVYRDNDFAAEEVLSLPVGTGLMDSHVTVTITMPLAEEETAYRIANSVRRL